MALGPHGSSGPIGPSGDNSTGGGSGPTGGNKGPQGTTRDGIPYQPGKPKLKAIPPVDTPDTNGGAVTPPPLDLSAIVAEQEAPRRRALSGVGVPSGGAGITGYAGIFIP